MIFSETNAKIAPALTKAWGSIENPKHNTSVTVKMKTGGSYKFEYTDLNGIFNEARRVFKENGISVIQDSYVDVVDGLKLATVETMLLHSSGEWVKSNKLQFPAATSMQDLGGQLTYMKRYSLSAMLGVSTEKDDDSNGASGNEYTYNQAPKGNNKPTGQQTPPTGQNVASEAQIKKINAMITKAIEKLQTQRENIIKALQNKEGIGTFESLATITKGQASRIISELEKQVGGAAE